MAHGEPEPLTESSRDCFVGKMLRELFAPDSDSDGYLMIARHGGGEGGVNVNYVGDTGRRMQAYRDDLFTAIRVMICREPLKKCLGPCGKMKAITQFGIDRSTADGRLRRCRQCERDRIAAWYKTMGRKWKRGPGGEG